MNKRLTGKIVHPKCHLSAVVKKHILKANLWLTSHWSEGRTQKEFNTLAIYTVLNTREEGKYNDGCIYIITTNSGLKEVTKFLRSPLFINSSTISICIHKVYTTYIDI